MSILYKDKNGKTAPIAGLNGLSGDLVIGASTIRTGTATLENVTTTAKEFRIIFDSPMPDNDYQISLQSDSGDLFLSAPYSKNANHFYVMAKRSQGNAYSPKLQYTAYKLYTAENVEQLEENVENLLDTQPLKLVEISTFNDFRAVEPGIYSFIIKEEISNYGIEKGVQGFFIKTADTDYKGYIYYNQLSTGENVKFEFTATTIKNKSDYTDFGSAQEYSLDRTRWINAGFGPDLVDRTTSTALDSGPIFYAHPDKDILIDMTDRWEELNNNTTLYVWSKPEGRFVIQTAVRQRWYLAKNVCGICRIAISHKTDDDLRDYLWENIKIYNLTSKQTMIEPQAISGKKDIDAVINWSATDRAIATLGDSITYGATATTNWPTELQKILGFPKLYNLAVSGSAYAAYSGRGTFRNQIATLKNKLENPDDGYTISHIILIGGINDWASNASQDTFQSGVISTFQDLADLPVNIPIYIVSPFNIAYDRNYGTATNKSALTFLYMRKTVEKLCKIYGFNYINGADFKFPANRNAVGGAECYSSDGLHLANAGQRYVAWKLADIIAGSLDFETHKYSTNETFTGNYWIDGRPIYRKVISHADAYAADDVVDSTLTRAYCDVISIGGTCTDGNGTNRFSIDYNFSDYKSNLYQNPTSGLKIQSSEASTKLKNYLIIVEYAKN